MVKVRRLWPASDSKAPQRKGQRSRRMPLEKVTGKCDQYDITTETLKTMFNAHKLVVFFFFV